MGEASENPLPTLIVVAGAPGSGKTSLAGSLARAIRCPAICRDEIKEGLVNTTGQSGEPGDDIARHVCDAFFDTIRLLLGRRITLVAEAAFQHKVWAPRLQPLQEMARFRIVVCAIDPQLARARHIERCTADPARAKFHHDRLLQSAWEGREASADDFDPPRLDVPTLIVNTSRGYQPSLEEIVSFASADA